MMKALKKIDKTVLVCCRVRVYEKADGIGWEVTRKGKRAASFITIERALSAYDRVAVRRLVCMQAASMIEHLYLDKPFGALHKKKRRKS